MLVSRGHGSNYQRYFMLMLILGAAKTEPTKLPLVAKMGIKKDWEENQVEVEKKIADELNGAHPHSLYKNNKLTHLSDEKVTCHADYPAIWKTIVDVHSSLSRSVCI